MEYSKAYRQLVFGAYDILFVMSLIPCLGCICVGLLLRLIGRLDGCIHFWCGYVAVTLYVGCRQFLELSRPEQCSVIKKMLIVALVSCHFAIVALVSSTSNQIFPSQDSSRICQRRYFISTEKYQLHKPAILNENVKQGNRLITPKTRSAKRNKKVNPAKIALWRGWIFSSRERRRQDSSNTPEAGASRARARAAATAGADSHALSPHRHLFDPLVSSSSPLSLSPSPRRRAAPSPVGSTI
jgi:hypothetical protein